MNLDTFFEKFELFADAPNAVAKMRELILDLAVRGKLVPQDPNDVPAAQTLSAVGINRGKCLLNAEDQRYVVPDSWCWVRFSNVGEQRLGKMLDAQKNRGVSRRYLRNTNVQWMRFDLDDIKEMRIEESECDELRLKNGDLLICEGGEPGRCAIWYDESSEMYFQKALHRVRPCNAVLSEFLALNLRIDCLNGVLEGYFTGATIKHLTGRSLGEYPIAIPPLAEQKRIVAKVDELIALCDRLEAQQQQRETRHTALAQASLTRFADAPTPANLELLFHKAYAIEPGELRKSILTLAVQGKLVPHEVEDSVEQLLHVVGQERTWAAANLGMRVPKSIPAVDAVEIPHDIPEHWRWDRIGRLALLIEYGTSQKAEAAKDKIPVYRMGNINSGRLLDENMKFVEENIEDLPALYLKTDDLLFNRTNSYELVGKTAIYKGRSDTCTFASYLIRVRLPLKCLCADFFNTAMNAPYFRNTQINPEITQQCGQANFNGTKLASTLVPVPPLAEQKRIVAKVEQLMGLVDRLEAQLAESRAKATALLEAVVAELSAAA